MMAPSVGTQLGSYMSFLSDYPQAEALKLMWQNISIRCIFNDPHRNILLPMIQLPTIYLILLAYVELSTVKTTQGGSIVSAPANIYLDMDSHAFVLCNFDDPIQPIALNKENSTYASPLILAGERQIETSGWPSLFNRGIFGSGSNLGHRPLLRICNR